MKEKYILNNSFKIMFKNVFVRLIRISFGILNVI